MHFLTSGVIKITSDASAQTAQPQGHKKGFWRGMAWF
jgi:hypothetical protein